MKGVGPESPDEPGQGATTQAALAYSRIQHGSEAFDRFVDRWAPDLRSTESASITRLAVIFGCIAMTLIILIFGFLLSTPDTVQNAVDELETASGEMNAERSAGTNQGEDLMGGFQLEEVIGGGEVLLTVLELPRSMQDASDAVLETTLGFRMLADSVAREESSDLIAQQFTDLVDAAGKGWFLSAERTRNDLRQSVAGVFVAAGDDGELGDLLLAILAPPNPGAIIIDQIPQASWGAGLLADLGQDASISPMIRDRARSLLAARGIGVGEQPGFASGAPWLAQVADAQACSRV